MKSRTAEKQHSSSKKQKTVAIDRKSVAVIRSFKDILNENADENESTGVEVEINKRESSILQEIEKKNLQENIKLEAKNRETIQNNSLTFNEAPIDHSIMKQVDIEIPLDFSLDKESAIKEKTERVIKFFDSNPIIFYEYINSKNSIFTASSLDMNSYNNYNEQLTSNKAEFDREVIYVDAMSGLYNKFLESSKEKDFFYILSPLTCFYYFKIPCSSTNRRGVTKIQASSVFSSNSEINKSGVLISNFSDKFISKLEENHIKSQTIKKKVIEKAPLNKSNKNSSLEKFQFVGNYDRLDQEKCSLLYIKDFYTNLFYNLQVNEFQDNFFKVLSPFPFQSGTYKTCKVSIGVRNSDTTSSINIKIIGCIFHYTLKDISTMLQNEFRSFTIQTNSFLNTQGFYIANSSLNSPLEKIHFKQGEYVV